MARARTDWTVYVRPAVDPAVWLNIRAHIEAILIQAPLEDRLGQDLALYLATFLDALKEDRCG